MGRAERRAQEKRLREQQKREELILKARANQKKLSDEEVDRIQDKLVDMNVNALLNAFAVCLSSRHKVSENDIIQDLQFIDELVGKVGSQEIPTYEDFRTYCAAISGVGIGMTPAEMEQFNIQEEKNFNFILMYDSNDEIYIQKIKQLAKTDEYLLINLIGGEEDGRVIKIDPNTDVYYNRKEAEHALKQMKGN